MKVQVLINRFTWQHAPSGRLEEILQAWADTPYRPGQCVPGVGVDCIHFGGSVLDAWTGRTDKVKWPSDRSLHTRHGSMKVMKMFARRYPAEPILDRVVIPGDVLVFGPEGGGPGHIAIVGTRENTMWHAQGNAEFGGVCYTGLCEASPVMMLKHAYRLQGRQGF